MGCFQRVITGLLGLFSYNNIRTRLYNAKIVKLGQYLNSKIKEKKRERQGEREKMWILSSPSLSQLTGIV